MTVQTRFHNWQQAPRQPWPTACSPLCVTWRDWLLATWGGQNLGCWAQRPIVGGSSPSTHASGAALDWRYQDPGIGRSRMLAEVMPWLLDNSLELGVQAVHDYVGCRIWRPPGTSGRPAGGVDAGWRAQTPGSQMGQAWALWIHIEVLDTRWSDTRSIPDLLPPAPTPPVPGPDDGDDDMPITDDEINRIARAVWQLQIGDPVTGAQTNTATVLGSIRRDANTAPTRVWQTQINDAVTGNPANTASQLGWARRDASAAAGNTKALASVRSHPDGPPVNPDPPGPDPADPDPPDPPEHPDPPA